MCYYYILESTSINFKLVDTLAMALLRDPGFHENTQLSSLKEKRGRSKRTSSIWGWRFVSSYTFSSQNKEMHWKKHYYPTDYCLCYFKRK